MEDLGQIISQSFWMYALAIVIAIAAAVLIRFIVLVLERRQASKKTDTAFPASAASAMAADPGGATDRGDGVNPDHVAAISAALYASLGAHRIVRVEPVYRHPTWADQGRWQLQSSRHARY